ncbi:DUF4304 domain-containing protein [Dactylosporangium salmoneum]|uniref:DUF4304 domain-containing protein n=1 Tax=Dactylosporangium salmoneum TaxID=53361 RepID=A0ABN3HKR4_9ACTN
MVSEVRRAFNQMMAGQVGPFLRGHGFQDQKKGHFLRVVDGVGAASLWFQNSNYPGHAPYYINFGAGTQRWIAYSGGSVEAGLGQLSGRIDPPPELAFAPGADMWILRTPEAAAEHGAGVCRTFDEIVFPRLAAHLEYNAALEVAAGRGTPGQEPPRWRGVVNRMMYPQHLDNYFAWLRAGRAP